MICKTTKFCLGLTLYTVEVFRQYSSLRNGVKGNFYHNNFIFSVTSRSHLMINVNGHTTIFSVFSLIYPPNFFKTLKFCSFSSEEPPLPSPASSRSPSIVRSNRRSRRKKRKKRSYRKHSSSSYDSSRSRSRRSRFDKRYMNIKYIF